MLSSFGMFGSHGERANGSADAKTFQQEISGNVTSSLFSRAAKSLLPSPAPFCCCRARGSNDVRSCMQNTSAGSCFIYILHQQLSRGRTCAAVSTSSNGGRAPSAWIAQTCVDRLSELKRFSEKLNESLDARTTSGIPFIGTQLSYSRVARTEYQKEADSAPEGGVAQNVRPVTERLCCTLLGVLMQTSPRNTVVPFVRGGETCFFENAAPQGHGVQSRPRWGVSLNENGGGPT